MKSPIHEPVTPDIDVPGSLRGRHKARGAG